jgi:putative RecB family exonuclease
MILSELRKTEHLSASSISSYIDCSLAYKFSKIDRIPFEGRFDAMEFGSAIHKTLEQFYLEKMIGDNLLLKDIHSIFDETWKKQAEGDDQIQYTKGHDFKSLMMLGKDLLSTWFNKKPDDNYNILGIEEAFSFHLPGIPIPFIGAMDLIEQDEVGTIIITDFKTSGKSYSVADVDQNQQLTLYQMAIKSMGYENREVLLKFDTFIKTKVPKFEVYWTTRSELDEHRLIRKANQVWDGIQKGVFIPNDTSWKCKNCSYAQACNEWFQRRIAS